MRDILIFIYIIFVFGHLFFYLEKKKSYLFVILTSLFIFFLMSGHKYVGNGDAIDFYGYWYGYTNFEILELSDFWFYYLFYLSERIGIYLSLNFYQWWAVMTVLSLFFIISSIKKREYNPHLFFIFFLIYYVFLFYGGLKFFYGFCLFQYAFSFLLKGEKGGKLKFILFTILAGGFHVMYYMFLVFLLIDLNKKRKKYLLKIIIIFSLTTSVFTLLIGRNFLDFIQVIVDDFENERLSIYFGLRTNLGFLLPIGIHLLTTFYAFIYREIVKKHNHYKLYLYANTLFYVNLIALVFYPLFMIALTFMRLLTSLSLTTIMASGYGQEYFKKKERIKLLLSGFMIICLYYYINMYLGGYMEKTVLPFFDSYYFN